MEFFRRHSGYAVGRRLEGALQLARAECAAEQLGWRPEWNADPDPDLSWMPARQRQRPHDVYCASMMSGPGDHEASVCGVVDPSATDQRVIEASLALEARAYDRLQGRH